MQKNCSRFDSLSLNMLSDFKFYIFHFRGFKTVYLAIMWLSSKRFHPDQKNLDYY